MTMSKNRSTKLKVVVQADPGTETFVIDDHQELKARGVGNFSTAQRPGEYRVKFRRGTAIQVSNRVIKRGATPVIIKAPELRFSSPAALDGTTKTHEYHMDNASLASRQVHIRLGTGSQLFFFTRAWTAAEAAGSLAGHDPATGLTLHDLEGNLLVDFEQNGIREVTSPLNPRFDPWAGCNIEVNPGAYRLRLDTPNWGAIEQVIVASPNWQTQIFLLQKAYGDKTQLLSFRADLPDAAILLAPIGQGFRHTSPDFQLCELARVALEDHRSTLAEALVERSLGDGNPMLGMYVAHTLLPRSNADRRLLSKIVGKLRSSLGPHPDVEALAMALNDRAMVRTHFETPPMLRTSWAIVMKQSQNRPKLVPHDSLSARVSTNLWGNSVWLQWLANELDSNQLLDVDGPVKKELSTISKIAKRLEPDAECGYPKALVKGDLVLTQFEEALLAYLGYGHTEQGALMTALGLPPAAFRTTVRCLLKKLRTAATGLLTKET